MSIDNDFNEEGLVHELRPFNTAFDYIPSLRRCGGGFEDGVDDGGECTTVGNRPSRILNILTNDTSFCPPEDFDPPYNPNVNNVTEAIRVLDESIGSLNSTERHWAYAAFYEPEGWTEDTAPLIKGVRHPFPPQHLLAGFI